MANRDNHYEAAFEEYLRSRGVPYVAVDEAKRSVLSDDPRRSRSFPVSPHVFGSIWGDLREIFRAKMDLQEHGPRG